MTTIETLRAVFCDPAVYVSPDGLITRYGEIVNLDRAEVIVDDGGDPVLYPNGAPPYRWRGSQGQTRPTGWVPIGKGPAHAR